MTPFKNITKRAVLLVEEPIADVFVPSTFRLSGLRNANF